MSSIRDGNVDVTNGSTTVTGNNTTWVDDGVSVGDLFPLSSWDGEKVSFDGYTVITQRVCDEWAPGEDE